MIYYTIGRSDPPDSARLLLLTTSLPREQSILNLSAALHLPKETPFLISKFTARYIAKSFAYLDIGFLKFSTFPFSRPNFEFGVSQTT